MVEEIDIWRSAHQLLKQHGETAGWIAALKADGFKEAGDPEGEAVWMRILAAINELENTLSPISRLN